MRPFCRRELWRANRARTGTDRPVFLSKNSIACDTSFAKGRKKSNIKRKLSRLAAVRPEPGAGLRQAPVRPERTADFASNSRKRGSYGVFITHRRHRNSGVSGMLVREYIEQREADTLSRFATLSRDSRGREHPLEPCPLRTDFVRDRDRILHCKSFRRLKHKTQVFLAPQGDHYRTRLTHTLEVSQIARSISRALRLNEDLTEAIAMGHDLGPHPVWAQRRERAQRAGAGRV